MRIIRYAIYSRKSKWTGKGESIENQIEMCRDYIAKHISGAENNEITVFEDEGFSGKSLERPQFQKMLRAARQGQLDCIICYRLDRISRSIGDFSVLIQELNDRGISFICIKEQFDTSTPMGRAMMYIASVFAQLERETIAERVRDNMLMLARTGRWLGGATPTGFVSERAEEVILDGKRKASYQLKWNPQEIQTVKLIYTKFLELQSVSGVSKYLIEKDIRSRNGKFFSLPGIKDILTNPVYCIADQDARAYFVRKESDVCFEARDCSEQIGLLSYNKRDYTRKQSSRLEESEWIIAKGRHKGIIRGADWVMIQHRLEERKNTHPEVAKTSNDYALLSGLLICTKCRERMFAKQRSNHETLFDYICSSKMRGGKQLCDCPNLNGPETDALVCANLMEYMVGDSCLCQQLVRLKQSISAEAGLNPMAALEASITRLEEEISGYVSACAKPGLSDALIQNISSRVSALHESRNELDGKRKQLQSVAMTVPNSPFQLDMIARSLSSLRDNLPNLTTCERRELVRHLAERIEWDGSKLSVFLYRESKLP